MGSDKRTTAGTGTGAGTPSEILETLVTWVPRTPDYQHVVAPIIVRYAETAHDPATRREVLFNRLVYSIIDQQRSVKDVIIPLWTSFMALNLNRAFFCHEDRAREFLSALFQAYGHQLYHTHAQNRIRGKALGSMVDAVVALYRELSPERLVALLRDSRDDMDHIFAVLTRFKYLKHKAVAFFLRDVEGFDFSLLPIDSNVARSLQLSGLYFAQRGVFDFETYALTPALAREVVPLADRTVLAHFRNLSDAIFGLHAAWPAPTHSPQALNRFLFVLGEQFCQDRKCASCRLARWCLYHNLPPADQEAFWRRLKKR